nr:portal protein [Coralloluteibacterium stylophorae]
MKSRRTAATTRAKACADLSLPKLYREDGDRNARSAARTPMQSTGAKCVNALTGRTLSAMFPPNAAPFRLSPDADTVSKLAEDAGVERGEVETALAEVERTIVNEFETAQMRPACHLSFQHGIVAGNFLFYVPDEGPPKVYPVTRFVCERDGLGQPLEMVTVDTITADALDDATRTAVQLERPEPGADRDPIDLHTRIVLVEDKWECYQEVNGHMVPGSDGSYPKDECPWIAVAVPVSDSEDYGAGVFFDYLGDFTTLEALRKAIRKGAAAAAKILYALDPGSPVRERQITEAESGAIVRMKATDLSTVSLDKLNDFRFVTESADRIQRDLEQVFGVRTSIQRNGERVTAEEIRYLAMALDETMGGFYSLLAEAFLLPLVKRLIARLQKQGRLPEFPPGVLKPRITVGTAALGRGHDLQQLVGFVEAAKAAVGPEEVARRLNGAELLARFAAAADVSPKGLIRSDEELAEEQDNTALNEGLIRAAPQLAQAAMQPQGTP